MTINGATTWPSYREPMYGPNEIDFDDERDEDQYPLDTAEADEAGVLLDDPEQIEPDT